VLWLTARRLAAQGLSDFTTSGGVPTCNGTRQPTPAVSASFYKANAPERRSLREAGAAGSPLHVSGAVIGLKCGVIKDALVELWQADARGQYDMAGFQFRAAQRTDPKGTFAFDTIVPGAAAGRARRLHVRVTPPGHAALLTELFFPDDPARSGDPSFKPDLVMKADPLQPHAAMTFDVVFDL
jgi:protocatechuate 3,4-dioxygenase beta subunit